MFTGEMTKYHEEYPNKIIVPLLNGKSTWSPIWDNHPYIKKMDDVQTDVDFVKVETKPNGRRWYVQSWSDHIEYTDWSATPGIIKFTRDERAEVSEYMAIALNIPNETTEQGLIKAPFCILNPDFKGTTSADNKDWGWHNWETLVKLIGDEIPIFQIMPGNDYTDVSGRVKVKDKVLPNVHPIKTNSVRMAFAILEQAKWFVSGEGGMHHAAAALGVPGVVIFGGFINPHSTGYYFHVNIADAGPPCGTLYRSCRHCREIMESITPEMVKTCIASVG